MLCYAIFKVHDVIFLQNNRIYSSVQHRHLEYEARYPLKNSDLQIYSSIINTTFDNDDNPYIKFRATIQTPNNFREIPMVKCD